MIPVQEMKSVIVLGYGYEDLKESNNKKVVFNGQIVRDSFYSDFGLMKHFSIYENKYSEWIRDEGICDLFQGEDCEIKIQVDQEFLNDDMLLESSDTMLSFTNKKCCVQFEGKFNSEEWDKGCSIRDITYGLRDKIQERGNVTFACQDSETVLNGFILRKEDPSSEMYLKVHQRVTFVFQDTSGGMKCAHIHCSNPYQEMMDGKLFPEKIGRQFYNYVQERLAALEEETKQQNRQLEVIMSSIAGGLKISNDDDTYSFAFVSREAAALFGYTVEEFMEVTKGSAVGPG